MSVNINGILSCAHQALPLLKRASGAAMINMCSLSATYGLPSEASYSASKFWVKGFTEALNIEWEQHGIYACDIMPNFVATPMMEGLTSKLVQAIGVHLSAADVAKAHWARRWMRAACWCAC